MELPEIRDVDELIIESAAERSTHLRAERSKGIRSINGESLACLDAADADLSVEEAGGESGGEIELNKIETDLDLVACGVG